jgi:uncharacterized integral membrane protein
MVKNVLFVCLLVIVIVFVVQNTEVVEFKFLVWTVSMSRALVLLGTLAIGLIAGWLFSLPRSKKKRG